MNQFKNAQVIMLPTKDFHSQLEIDTLSKDWYLEITKENIEKASEWRKAMCTIKNPHYLSNLNIGYSLVSKHSNDSSFYHYDNLSKSKNPNYRNYKELTTEQFIKHVYNPKFNVMENKEEYVIKCLTLEHGEEIIQHFKDLGVETNNIKGTCSEKEGYYAIYYGLINGNFSNYSLTEVQRNCISIKELPKKELNMEKEIIGYKLVRPEYKNAAEAITGNWENSQNGYDIPIKQVGYIKLLKEAGVLDLWFEPVYKTEEKVYTLGIDEKFEIIVKDKKAFYGSEDVTETLLAFKKIMQFVSGDHKIGKYSWCIADTVITSVGCITKESFLSQWLAIDLT